MFEKSMVVHRRIVTLSIAAITLIVVFACGSGNRSDNHPENTISENTLLAHELENSLFDFIIDPWYPRIMDTLYGGYFQFLRRDGSPVERIGKEKNSLGDSPATGLKDYNSSIHLMEAFTELYRIWPDSLVRTRLEEMYYLIRDTFVHPDGFLQLYFYPDWI